MKSLNSLIAGIFVLMLIGWIGMIVLPFYQFGQQGVYLDEDSGLALPPAPTGEAIAGQAVYLAQGCVYCHTQQVRDIHQGSDLVRGWGERRSVARDYMFRSPASLGYMRMGPDLSNIGSDQRIIKTLRLYEDDRFAEETFIWETAAGSAENSAKIRDKFSDDEWDAHVKSYKNYLFQHLYAPRSLNDWSLMPSFKSLFKEIPLVGAPSAFAVNSNEVKLGYQAVPGPEAEALVAYLMSLDQSYGLPEASG